MATTEIAVIGAGVIGLSTAINLQNQFPGVKVTVIADKIGEETTSAEVTGIFRPNPKYSGLPADEAVLRRWCTDSYKYFDALATSDEAGEAGVCLQTLYDTSSEPINPFYKDFVVSFRHCEPQELKTLFPRQDNLRFGVQYTTMVIDGKWYVPWLLNNFREQGGQVQRRTVRHLAELHPVYKLVVNCTGLGSRSLVPDETVISNRGQALRVHAPWLHHGISFGESVYVLPGRDSVLVGGTRQTGDYNAESDPGDTKRILQQAYTLVPSLRKAKVVETLVGLRPNRERVRIEAEVLGVGLKVVHNYGHGGNGIGLSWGSAIHATKLVKEMM